MGGRVAALAVALLALVAGRGFGEPPWRQPGIGAAAQPATPVGGVAVEPSDEPLRLAGCAITPRPPEEREGLVVAQAGFRCEAGSRRRNVTVELWQLDAHGFWRPVDETDETYATAPGMGSSRSSGPRFAVPLGPDEISCRATPAGVRNRFRTYAAAFGSNGEPLLHAGDEASLPRDCLAGMAVEHATLLGLPPDSPRRVRLPPRELLERRFVCPAFLLSPQPVRASDCPGGRRQVASATPPP